MAQIAQTDNRWLLNGDVVVSTANDILIKSQLCTIGDDTIIDFSGVEDIDTTAVSLILEWKRRAAKENKSLTFAHLPKNLTSLVQLYDVAAVIG